MFGFLYFFLVAPHALFSLRLRIALTTAGTSVVIGKVTVDTHSIEQGRRIQARWEGGLYPAIT